MDEALLRAIQRAGGLRPLARALGIKAQSIESWKTTPPLRVLQIEHLTGVSRYKLRPDIYGLDPKKGGGQGKGA